MDYPKKDITGHLNSRLSYRADNNTEETQEWLDSLDGLLQNSDKDRAKFILLKLLEKARQNEVPIAEITSTDFVNTISYLDEPEYPGNEKLERAYRKYLRWNAAVMVHRAQRPGIEAGGHVSTYASIATLYEVGFNYFFKGNNNPAGADQVFFQGHSSPGIYSRAFLEGRLTAEQLDGYRQQFSNPAGGLPSYPHPRQLPNFWQFPTVSMGLGPMNAIYQARFNRYLENRGIKDTSQQNVWAFLGDGEMDEPESRGLAQVAAQNGLDNLIYVINCNLQRLDGPVRGNGKIIQELESFFLGAGWNVIKVIWGREWDNIFKKDTDNALIDLMNQTPDGDFQTFAARDGKYIREHFFGKNPATLKLVEDLSDEDLWSLKRGGHDYRKVYAAYKAATELKNGKPTVILAHTIKGYSLGKAFTAKNATHQMKKFKLDELKILRDNLEIPISDAELEKDPYNPPYLTPGPESEEISYMLEKRQNLGGFIPERKETTKFFHIEKPEKLEIFKAGSGNQKVASTMALVRIFKELIKNEDFGKRIVPIIPDEARTFGLDSWFHTYKIYNPKGQEYTAVDADLMLTYKEAKDGQVLHEGINETGSTASFIAAGTSYSTHNEPMIPMYIFYSMFGFQRSGDNLWAAADQMAKGFIVGGTAGRTTLVAEGLQHNDGHSLLIAHTNPAVKSYDPAFSYEILAIIKRGIEEMYGEESKNVYHYITVYNQPISQPVQPDFINSEDIIKGIYLYDNKSQVNNLPHANILASGIGMQTALEAQELLMQDWDINTSLYSVTSWGELNREAVEKEKAALLSDKADTDKVVPHVTKVLSQTEGPYIAVSDWSSDVENLISKWVPGQYNVLGTDGFGISDTRFAARRYFHTDKYTVAYAVIKSLLNEGKIPAKTVEEAIKKYELDKEISELTIK